MATYSGTTDPNIVNKYFTGTTEINLGDYLTRFNALKDSYLEVKENATKLYDDLKPIYDAGLLPTGYTTQYLQLENFVT